MFVTCVLEGNASEQEIFGVSKYHCSIGSIERERVSGRTKTRTKQQRERSEVIVLIKEFLYMSNKLIISSSPSNKTNERTIDISFLLTVVVLNVVSSNNLTGNLTIRCANDTTR